MKISKELDDVLRQASAEVNAWPKWKRSLDPIGDESRDGTVRAKGSISVDHGTARTAVTSKHGQRRESRS